MKRLFLMLALVAVSAFAEPSFQDMQGLIEQKQFAAAEQGLEVILKNHPDSAKAFYSMAQAQAGLGHLDKAQFALNKARGLDPALKFATEDNVKNLEQAITPQVAKIEKVEESHFWRNLFLAIVALGLITWAGIWWSNRPKKSDNDYTGHTPPRPMPPSPSSEFKSTAPHDAVGVLPTETTNNAASIQNTYTDAYAPRQQVAPVAPTVAPAVTTAPQPTIINNHYGSNNNGNDLLTGVLIGEMISEPRHHTTYVEREVVVERPVYTAPRYEQPIASKTWEDDTPSQPSRSSSWDDDSSSKSSSWSSSSSDSSSSWSSSSSDSSSGSSDW